MTAILQMMIIIRAGGLINFGIKVMREDKYGYADYKKRHESLC